MNHRFRLLVVEDSPTQAVQIESLLEAAGYDVELAKDGVRQMKICDESHLVQVATALDEALVNAITHGNLTMVKRRAS